MMKYDMRIFCGSSSVGFANKMCSYLNIEKGDSDVITFSEGNTFVRINEPVRGKDVYLVQSIGLRPNDEFVEILFWMDAFKRASAKSVTAIIPYFSYAKGDKKDEPRVSIRARVCAECIELAGADRIITMDLHSPQIQGFFKKPVDHLQAMLLFCEQIKLLNLENYVIVSPDAGYAKQAREYSKYLGVSTVIADKARVGHNEKADILDVIGDVKGKNIVIVDDFIISGGTLIDLSYKLKKLGAQKIITCTSHILSNEKSIQQLNSSEIGMLITTDSIYNPSINLSSKIKVVSAAPLFAEAILRIHNNISISPLFKALPEKAIRLSDQYNY
ncbi:MAG: ribose-phosphate diphosphokinase [Clostridia bacterium]|nr:ribose-phosphate diphosphokinase [Clostridia bacterium]